MAKRHAGELTWTDMTCAPDALAGESISLDQVLRHCYVRDASGTLYRGADAIALL